MKSDIPLLPTTWRPLVFMSLITGHKWMDISDVSNDYFAGLFQFFDTEQLNVLEMKFYQLIHYDTMVKFSTYGKYYLELKEARGEEFPLKQMDKASMEKLSKDYGHKKAKYALTVGENKESGMSTKFIIS